MMGFWQNLSDRDKLSLSLGLLLSLSYLFYLLLIAPLRFAIEEKKQMLDEKQITLSWMQTKLKAYKNEAGLSDNGLKKLSGAKLLTLVANQLSLPPLKAFTHQLQQSSQGELQLSFDAVSYQVFLTWLWTLSHEYRIEIKHLSLEKTSKPGIVKVSLIFL